MKKSKKPASFGIIFDNNKTQILILKRRDVAVWTLPGGGIDENETAEEAVIRELKEETGFTVAIVRKIACYSPLNNLASQTHTFECRIIGGKIIESDESNGIRFCAVDDLPRSFFFLHREWLDDALLNASTVIEKPLTSVTYFNLFKQLLRHPFKVLRFALSNFLYSYK